MRNKLFLISASLFLMAAFLILNSCKKDDSEDATIQVAGVEFKSNYFVNDGEIAGIDADMAAIALQNSNVAYNMSMSDFWQSAYDATLHGPNKALLTTAYTPERQDLFKWAGPTSQGMYGIFENGNSAMSDLTQHMEVLNFKEYIAFSLNTPASTVQQWQNHLDAMKADGTFETIWNKWFSGVPMP